MPPVNGQDARNAEPFGYRRNHTVHEIHAAIGVLAQQRRCALKVFVGGMNQGDFARRD